MGKLSPPRPAWPTPWPHLPCRKSDRRTGPSDLPFWRALASSLLLLPLLSPEESDFLLLFFAFFSLLSFLCFFFLSLSLPFFFSFFFFCRSKRRPASEGLTRALQMGLALPRPVQRLDSAAHGRKAHAIDIWHLCLHGQR